MARVSGYHSPAEGELLALSLTLLALCWWAIAIIAAPRDRTAWVVVALALVVRWMLTVPELLLHGDYPYLKLLVAMDLDEPPDIHGLGSWAFYRPFSRVLGADTVHAVNLLMSSLLPLWVHGILDRLKQPREVALTGAVVVALMPVCVAMSQTETLFVLVATLQAAALFGALDFRTRGAWLAAVSVGLLVNMRPLQFLWALLPVALLLNRRAWGPLALFGLFAGSRALELVPLVADGSGSSGQFGRLLDAFSRPGHNIGRGSGWLITDLTSTPLVVGSLVLVAMAVLAASWRDRRLAGLRWPLIVAFVALVLSAVPGGKFWLRDDQLRFLLPAQTWWAIIAVLGLRGLWVLSSSKLLISAVVVTWCATTWAARSPLEPRQAWMLEHRFLQQEVAPRIAPDDVVRFHSASDRHGRYRRWLNAALPGTWIPHTGGPPRVGELRLVSWIDALSHADSVPDCDLVALVETVLPSEPMEVELPDRPMVIGLYRVADCSRHEVADP